jgi:hypothetical protein
MSNFQTKVDFSTQIKEYANTEGTLSGSVNVQQYTTLGTDYADLPLGLNPLTTGISATYVYSTMGYFTGTTGSTTYYFTDSNMDIANPYLSTLNGTNSGLTQNVAAFIPTYSTTIDGNYFDVIYSGVSFDMTPASFEEYTVGEFSGVTFTNVLNYLSGTTYPWWFLKSGSTTWGEVKGRLQTDRMTIIEGAFPGYVLTSDSNGNATWQVSTGGASGTTIVQFTGNTSASCITDLYVTNIHGCSPIHIQPTSADDVIMVEGGGNVGIGLLPTVKLHISGETIVNANKMMLSDSLTTIPPINFSGIFSVHDFFGGQGFISSNTNPSGTTGFRMSNDSSVSGQLIVGGSQSTRGLSPLTGDDFYRNKVILRGDTTSEGMVFNATSSNPSSTFWWEFNGASGMVLKGDGSTTGAYLGLSLNPDGTEMPTSSLQIGGTGTTGTVQVNQDVLNVNAKNTYGKVRPNYYTTIDSGTTSISAGIYPITISSGWVIEQVQIYTKIPDSVLTAGSLVNITTSGGTWSPGTSRAFGFSSGRFANMINIYGGTFIDPVYFPVGDTLLVSFIDPMGSTTDVTDGEYKVLITYWDGSEIL